MEWEAFPGSLGIVPLRGGDHLCRVRVVVEEIILELVLRFLHNLGFCVGGIVVFPSLGCLVIEVELKLSLFFVDQGIV